MNIALKTSLFLALSFPIITQADAQRIKILPLGDSTSCASKYKVSYRYPLWKLLLDAGKDIDFVGSQILEGNYGRTEWPEYKGLNFPPANEAHAGWRTDQVLDGLPNGTKGLDTWLTGQHPDIALIHLGTNDIDQSQSPESTRDDLEKVIGKLRKNNPEVKILIASIIPMKTDTTMIPRLNKLIAQLAKKLNRHTSPVVNVDMYTGYDVEKDMQHDHMHPNVAGEKKIAKRWFDAMTQHHFLD